MKTKTESHKEAGGKPAAAPESCRDSSGWRDEKKTGWQRNGDAVAVAAPVKEERREEREENLLACHSPSSTELPWKPLLAPKCSTDALEMEDERRLSYGIWITRQPRPGSNGNVVCLTCSCTMFKS
ncbi:hypothetical protein PIB30_104973 [Stylosanthes scabra]|uniref:Uncharacterized protein n=1 Tax=Stylosanthes scabra TaxID=79078 RepID=A0ABU6SZL6_9FABA|nr:hypothetical protein [Stylosanthes scabra]